MLFHLFQCSTVKMCVALWSERFMHFSRIMYSREMQGGVIRGSRMWPCRVMFLLQSEPVGQLCRPYRFEFIDHTVRFSISKQKHCFTWNCGISNESNLRNVAMQIERLRRQSHEIEKKKKKKNEPLNPLIRNYIITFINSSRYQDIFVPYRYSGIPKRQILYNETKGTHWSNVSFCPSSFS